MPFEKPDVSRLKYRSGLDLKEIQIEQSINELISLLKGTRSEKKRDYLRNEIAHRKRQLKLLRAEKPCSVDIVLEE